MSISIAIADKEKEYLLRISRVLQRLDDFRISIYTDAEQFQGAISSGNYDIALFDPDISDRRLSFNGVKLPILLYSDEAKNRALYSENKMLKVSKYQRISSIYKSIIGSFADVAGYRADFDNSENTKIIAVYSPVGGSGKTTVSLALASAYAGIGKRVLLISAEQLDSTVVVNAKGSECLTNLISKVNDDKVNFELKARSMVQRGINDIGYISGFDRFVDYDDVSDEEFNAVIEKIRRYDICDIIVIDMQSSIDKIGKAIIAAADRVVIVERPGEIAAAKMKMFADQSIADENIGKMVKVCSFAENSSAFTDVLADKAVGLIHNYGNLVIDNVIKAICNNGEIQIGKILEK